MKAAAASLAADLNRPQSTKWHVTLRDGKGHILPVMVPEAESEHSAISRACNRAARFGLGTDWTPVSAHRSL